MRPPVVAFGRETITGRSRRQSGKRGRRRMTTHDRDGRAVHPSQRSVRTVHEVNSRHDQTTLSGASLRFLQGCGFFLCLAPSLQFLHGRRQLPLKCLWLGTRVQLYFLQHSGQFQFSSGVLI